MSNDKNINFFNLYIIIMIIIYIIAIILLCYLIFFRKPTIITENKEDFIGHNNEDYNIILNIDNNENRL